MKNPNIRLTALLLAAVTAASVLASCGGGETPAAETAAQPAAGTAEASAETTEEVTEDDTQPKVPSYDLGGADFTILVAESAGWVVSRDFEYDEESAGEPINDSVHERNILTEDLFNLKLGTVRVEDVTAAAKKELLADGHTYDAVMPTLTTYTTLSDAGLLYDLSKLPTMDFDQPWWSGETIRSLSIAGQIYFAMGDISIIDNDGIATLGFSKKLIEDNDLPSPYDYVTENTWTLDTMHALASGMNRDLNGDGKMNKEDQYGFVNSAANAIHAIYGCGEKMMKKDADDLPYCTVFTDENVAIMDKYLEFVTDATAYGDLDSLYGEHSKVNPYFANGQILFRMSTMFRFTQTREMESDFGFLPQPKYDEKQDSYHHALAESAPGVSIPVNSDDPDMVAAVVEALAFYGRTILLPAYYDKTLKGKIARDNESEAMLDIIYDTVTFDLGYLYNFEGMRDFFSNCVRKKSNTLASSYAAKEEAINTRIEELIDLYTSNN